MERDVELHDSRSEERVIDQIPTEKSALKRSIGKPVAPPGALDDAESRRKKDALRANQRRDRERQIKRYQVASMAYLGAYLRDSNAVSEVWEAVVEKWLSGALNGYDESRSFRTYLKTVLRNSVYVYWANQAKSRENATLQLDSNFDPAGPQETTASNAFDRELGQNLIRRAVESLRADDTLYFEALKPLMNAVASDQKKPTSSEVAESLSKLRGSTISADNARQITKRAREVLARKIIEQVGQLIATDDLGEIEQSLIDLNLLPYCERSLRKMRG